jgi:hypothetical protein
VKVLRRERGQAGRRDFTRPPLPNHSSFHPFRRLIRTSSSVWLPGLSGRLGHRSINAGLAIGHRDGIGGIAHAKVTWALLRAAFAVAAGWISNKGVAQIPGDTIKIGV